jgi:hypothetical protein
MDALSPGRELYKQKAYSEAKDAFSEVGHHRKDHCLVLYLYSSIPFLNVLGHQT